MLDLNTFKGKYITISEKLSGLSFYVDIDANGFCTVLNSTKEYITLVDRILCMDYDNIKINNPLHVKNLMVKMRINNGILTVESVYDKIKNKYNNKHNLKTRICKLLNAMEPNLVWSGVVHNVDEITTLFTDNTIITCNNKIYSKHIYFESNVFDNEQNQLSLQYIIDFICDLTSLGFPIETSPDKRFIECINYIYNILIFSDDTDMLCLPVLDVMKLNTTIIAEQVKQTFTLNSLYKNLYKFIILIFITKKRKWDGFLMDDSISDKIKSIQNKMLNTLVKNMT